MTDEAFRALIAEAKVRLPLPDLLRSYGIEPPRTGRGNIFSPFRAGDGRSKSPSFSLFQCANGGGWGWKDRSGGGDDGGDEITFIEKMENLSRAEAIRAYVAKAGMGDMPAGARPDAPRRLALPARPAAEPAPPPDAGGFDWAACVRDFTPEHAARLARWRGFSVPFVEWLHRAGLVGLWRGKVAFPVSRGGHVVAAHYRTKDGGWRYHPAGQGTHSFVIGELASAARVLVAESQWDAHACMERMGWHDAHPEGWAAFITRGASNGAMAAELPAGCVAYALKQNDEERNGKRAGDEWLADVVRACPAPVRVVGVPLEFKDANDWLKADAHADVWRAIEQARPVEKPPAAPTDAAPAPQKREGTPPPPECDPVAVAESLGVWWENASERYFLPAGPDKWLCLGTGDLRRVVRTEHGISARACEGRVHSPMDAVMTHINRARFVDYAASLAGWRAGVYDLGGMKVLVRDSPRMIEPAEGTWPTIAGLIYGLLKLPDNDQSPHLMAWLKTAVLALLNGTREPGQALIFVGDADSGKSRVQHQIITPLLGGRNADPKSYYFAKTDFNNELCGAEHLLIEELPALSRYDDRSSFGERIKETVVNDSVRLHRKNRDALTVSIWQRLTISLNDDQTRALPPMTSGLADKVMLFRVQRAPDAFWEQFAHAPDPRAAFRDAITRELPAFLFDLLAWEIPAGIRGRRFGVKAFHNLDVLAELFENEPECLLLDLIDRELFGNPSRHDPSEVWQGGAIDLENYLKADEMGNTVCHQARKLLSHEQACSQGLAKLKNRFPARVHKPPHTHGRVWRIFPPLSAED